MIDIRDLSVVFGSGRLRVEAVKGLSMRIAEGESFGLVGESGSGKSTVLRAICGLAPVSAGTIAVAGKPVPVPRNRAFFATVQMVFQDPYGSLHPRQTVDQILSEPLAIHRLSDRDRRIARALADVGLGSSFRFRYPHQLSGGQRQRVAIARALILDPRVILLDEPTSALDASVQAEILNLLERLRAERRLTYILVSHDLAVVTHLCDRLLVMRNGETVEETDTEHLRAGKAETAYTRALMKATEGFTRAAPASTE
ncbi:ABC transporter ATP-binding protein [Chelativorans sp. M5D2P16]|uniref:ABC transporter ATP-binding protein n=1 Tax=Chelativorans sp. M5D2P16 TaxID=3095678 RepID=UPI002ACAD8C9|nr:ABC transporter ATP-binding protein [Chelativorans sp. M5D2P16]MDZ5699999.1 ABC transporter ATP-binding protein [Chelativorans sp. M5D2P16]